MDNGRRVDLEIDPLNLVPGDIIFLQARGEELVGCWMNCFIHFILTCFLLGSCCMISQGGPLPDQ